MKSEILPSALSKASRQSHPTEPRAVENAPVAPPAHSSPPESRPPAAHTETSHIHAALLRQTSLQAGSVAAKRRALDKSTHVLKQIYTQALAAGVPTAQLNALLAERNIQVKELRR